jgi:hypothetical protein
VEFFEALGQRVGRAWRQAAYDELAFPEIAVSMLAESRFAERVTLDDIVHWTVRTDRIPHQIDLGAEFGQPPLSVYAEERFLIQVIFWLDGTTAIHQHAFSGAFGVLAGGSIHSEYDWVLRRRVNAHMQFGDIERTKLESLSAGDVRPIISGRRLIHSLFHLDRPSVSVVVRTGEDADTGPQYKYWRPHVAVDASFREPLLTRRLQILKMLLDIRHPRLEETARKMLEASDLEAACRILLEVAPAGDRLSFDTLVSHARALDADARDCMARVVAEAAREVQVKSRRALFPEPEHRFFLALLLNLSRREEIYACVRSRFPHAVPAVMIDRWIRAMSGLDRIGIEIDELNGFLLGHMIRGAEWPAIAVALSEEYDTGEVTSRMGELERHHERLKKNPILRPLFCA